MNRRYILLGILTFLLAYFFLKLGTAPIAVAPFYVVTFFLVIYFGRKHLKAFEAFCCLLSAHVLIATWVSHYPIRQFAYLAAVLGVPLLMFVLFRKGRPVPRYLVVFVFYGALIGDLFFFVYELRYLFSQQRHPKAFYGFHTRPRRPFLSESRRIQPELPPVSRMLLQQPRYASLMMRKPYLFSPGYQERVSHFLADRDSKFRHALIHRRWNSYLYLKGYYELIHSGLPEIFLKESFAIDSAFFSSKPQYKINSLSELSQRFRRLTLAEITERSKRILFLENSMIPQLNPMATEHPVAEASELNYRILHYDRNTVSLLTQMDHPTYLFWSEGYHPHWRAEVNGTSTPILKANYNFKSIYLPKGEHRVDFAFRPTAFLWAMGLFYFVLVGGCAVVIVSWVLEKFKFVRRRPALAVANRT